MKKKIFKIALAAAFIAATGMAYMQARQTGNEVMSEIMLENVEALARDESSGCSGGGVANVHCPIWHIKYSASFTGPNIECTTGGPYKCQEGTCPHGR